MPDIASTLKAEIARIARKELRAEFEPIRKANSQYRSAIAALRKKVDQVERQLRRATGGGRGRAAPVAQGDAEQPRQVRFSASRLAGHRAKLEISAADYGRLVGVSGQSIYAWEQGRARPRAAQLQALGSIKGLGKREVAARLAAAA